MKASKIMNVLFGLFVGVFQLAVVAWLIYVRLPLLLSMSGVSSILTTVLH